MFLLAIQFTKVIFTISGVIEWSRKSPYDNRISNLINHAATVSSFFPLTDTHSMPRAPNMDKAAIATET